MLVINVLYGEQFRVGDALIVVTRKGREKVRVVVDADREVPVRHGQELLQELTARGYRRVPGGLCKRLSDGAVVSTREALDV